MFRFFFCAYNPNAIGQRWQHIAVWYVIGYLICIAHVNISSWHYLIPIKFPAIAISWIFGHITYLRPGFKNAQIDMATIFYFSIKYFISAIFIMLFLLPPLKLIAMWLGIPMSVFWFVN